MIARSISVSPSCASSAAILMSQASANSSPPPSAKPRMAAMIAWGQGFLAVYDEVISYCWREGFHAASSSGRSTRSEARRPRRGHFCAVTNSELSVGPTGELLVCHAIPNSGYRSLDAAAAASGMPIPLALQQRTDDRVDECSGCEVEGLCGGGCTAQSARATGNARGNPGPVFCTLVRGRQLSEAIGEVARRLGNTVSICRRCYIHPDVIAGHAEQSLTAALTRDATSR